jgi:hypothetical protein
MSTGTSSCVECEKLLKELDFATQLCAEYESPMVFPIDGKQLTAEQADLLRNAAFEERIRVEDRVFLHQYICPYCQRSP